VGNLPRVNNMDIQYAQSAVFTPSDIAFPNNGIKAEATPNTEMVLVADVDLNALRDLHEYGTVKILKDRRHDLYSVKLEKYLYVNFRRSLFSYLCTQYSMMYKGDQHANQLLASIVLCQASYVKKPLDSLPLLECFG